MPIPHTALTEVLEQLADRFTSQLRGGEAPSIDDYADRHPQLAARIRTLFPLLEMMEREASTAGSPMETPSTPTPQFERLGDFRIIREIGRGGMGIVYQAEQESLGRTVALKLLPHMALDSRTNQRFHQEARLAAMLHHTNIVPIYGVGNEGGYSYFVMQFIEGTGLDRVLAELRLLRQKPGADSNADQPTSMIASALHANSIPADSLPDHRLAADAVSRGGSPGSAVSVANDTTKMHRSGTRLNLANASSTANLSGTRHDYWQNVARIGVQVADGLAHAHGIGILHRDIKPGNLLLDEAGSVWITDFGLARLTDSSQLTRTGEVVGTLRYLPPEQLSGQSDQRGDIYGLGVTLYELATLQAAFPESDPRKLMNQVAESRPVAPRKIDSQIPRDLETIILKSMAAEPEKRYATADELGADLRRFLAGQPILARRIGPLERLVKWSRRHPAIAGLSAAVVLLTLLGIAGITWQWRAADANFRQVQIESRAREVYFTKALEAVDQMLTRVGSELLADHPGTSQIRRGLLADALAFYEDFLRESGDDPTIQAEIGRVHRRIAGIHSRLGDSSQALAALQRSQDQFSQLHQSFPTRVEFLVEWAAAKNDRAMIELSLGRSDEAEILSRQAISHVETGQQLLADGKASDPLDNVAPGRLPAVLANAVLTLGTILPTSRNGDAAIEQFERAKQLFEAMPDEFLTDELRNRSAQNLDRLAQFYVDLNRWEEAMQLRAEALGILQALVDANPQAVAVRDTLANVRQRHSGLLMRIGQTELGMQGLAVELAEREELVSQFGELPSLQQGLARNLAIYATGLSQSGQHPRADENLDRALRILDDLTTRFPDNLSFLVELGYVTQTKATNLTIRQSPSLRDQCTVWSRKAYELRQRIVAREPGNAAYRMDLANAARTYSAALFAQNSQEPLLLELCQEAVEILESLLVANPDNAEMLYQLAFSQTNLSRARNNLRQGDAVEPLEQAITTFLKLVELRPHELRDRFQLTRAYDQLALLQFQLGLFEQWEQTLRLANRGMEEAYEQFGDDVRLTQFLTISQNRLAHCLKQRGAVSEAIQLFANALQKRKKEQAASPDNQQVWKEIASAHRNLAWANGLFADPPDLDAALAHAQAAVAIDAASPQHPVVLAYVHYRRGDWDSLNQLLQSDTLAAVDEPPLSAEYRMVTEALRAIAAHQLDDHQQVAEHLTQAVQIRASEQLQQNDLLRWMQPELFAVVDHAELVLAE
jgi:serine/threonine protein kinase